MMSASKTIQNSPDPAPFPLVLLFSTESHFCLHIAGHRLFDNDQQQVIAEMPPMCIRLEWLVSTGEAVLRVGRHREVLCDGNVTVYRFTGNNANPPRQSDWDALLYRVFKGGNPGETGWVRLPFSLSELRCHAEFARLTCRGAILAGAGGTTR